MTITLADRTLSNSGRVLAWIGFALAIVMAPMIFTSSLSLSILSQIGYLIVICLSYNILLGQGGMLSFGHAVYTGLGALVTVHAIQMAGSGQLGISLPFMPLIGGLAGAFFAALFGYVTTKKSGITFAMITLGIGELVAAMSLMFPGFFGGEGGVTADRVYGKPFLGLDFGPQIQVYGLIAVYCFVCTAAMYAFTMTPLGRLLNATRDNAERVEFLGYSTQRVRYLSFVIAGFFAGIGGGLAAINFEIINALDSLSVARSGSYALFTYLGGAAFFSGPIIGAVLLVLASVLLSDLTKAWLLYVGLFFVLMVMYAPGGIASIVAINVRIFRSGRVMRLLPLYVGIVVTAIATVTALSILIEMIYHAQLNAAMGPDVHVGGFAIDTTKRVSWIVAAGSLAIVGTAFAYVGSLFSERWGQIQEELEADSQSRGAA